MGSVIQHNLQAPWTPLGGKATKCGALSGTPTVTLAFICEEKQQRRWGGKRKNNKEGKRRMVWMAAAHEIKIKINKNKSQLQGKCSRTPLNDPDLEYKTWVPLLHVQWLKKCHFFSLMQDVSYIILGKSDKLY